MTTQELDMELDILLDDLKKTRQEEREKRQDENKQNENRQQEQENTYRRSKPKPDPAPTWDEITNIINDALVEASNKQKLSKRLYKPLKSKTLKPDETPTTPRNKRFDNDFQYERPHEYTVDSSPPREQHKVETAVKQQEAVQDIAFRNTPPPPVTPPRVQNPAEPLYPTAVPLGSRRAAIENNDNNNNKQDGKTKTSRHITTEDIDDFIGYEIPQQDYADYIEEPVQHVPINEAKPAIAFADPAPAKSKTGIGKKIGTISFYALLVLAIVTAFMFSGSDNGKPRSIFGYAYFTVLTDSMQSEIPQGSLVITKEVPAMEIQIGDDITYLKDDNTTVTHRVVEIFENYENSGFRGFRTKGIENPMADTDIVYDNNVIGVVQTSFPEVGNAMAFIKDHIIIILIGFALVLVLLISLKIFFSPSQKIETQPSYDLNTNRTYLDDMNDTDNADPLI